MSRGILRSVFTNATRYAALDVPSLDASGREIVIALVKATFKVAADGRARVADDQRPLRAADIPYDPDNPRGSIKYPSDVCDRKHGTDVVVIGNAIARTPVTALDVAVKVRDATAPLRVHGPRFYYRSVSNVVVGPAARFEREALVYEKAFGGASQDMGVVELRNPSGVGVARRDADLVDMPAPQIEHPAHPHQTPKDRHAPAGFGALAPHWSPRRERAGTFDDVWKASRMPLLPKDFDVRHNNAAHPALLLDTPLAPGDPVGVLAMTESGYFGFEIPPFPIVVRGRFDDGTTRDERPAIDTLLVEPAPGIFELVARASFPLGRARGLLRELTVDVDD
jgi:hypothetical protein